MTDPIRKRSPRAPSISLDEALERAQKIYAIEGKHPVPSDVIAKHLGYSSATNGTAATAIASIRYYGLLERPKEGFLAVNKEVEAYQFAPNDTTRQGLLRKWVATPPIFSFLLTKYLGSLPSPSTLKFDLLQAGFNPPSADACVAAFLRSVEFSKYYSIGDATPPPEQVDAYQTSHTDEAPTPSEPKTAARTLQTSTIAVPEPAEDSDQIPIRLSGGRKAWLIIPTPFYEADKQRLTAQIALLLTNDDA